MRGHCEFGQKEQPVTMPSEFIQLTASIFEMASVGETRRSKAYFPAVAVAISQGWGNG